MSGCRPGKADAEFRSPAMLYAFKNFIIDRTSQSAGARIRASIFNRCDDATVRNQEVPLVHAACHIIYFTTYNQSLHAINGSTAVGRVGNTLCRRPSYHRLGGERANTKVVVFGKANNSKGEYAVTWNYTQYLFLRIRVPIFTNITHLCK